jgi:hypothetical protein
MTKLVEEALHAITARTNLLSGLSHPNDEYAAKEMFKLLYAEGELLLENEITPWAEANGWQQKDAKELGELAEKIGNGGKVQIKEKGWWKENILDILKEKIDKENTES